MPHGAQASMNTRTASARRPLSSRDQVVFRKMAAALSRWKVSPNTVSISSMVFALIAGAALWGTRATDHGSGVERVLWLASAVFIQLRLLANMLDGMIAVEGGRSTALGDLFNELPDRFSDSVILVGAGYATGSHPVFGFVCAILAVMTAYVRAYGVSIGTAHFFQGPMAKPQRMFVLTLATLFCGVAPVSWRVWSVPSFLNIMQTSLIIIMIGSAITVGRRITAIARAVRKRR